MRETQDHVHLFDGPRQIATHPKADLPRSRSTLPEHRPPRRPATPPGPPPEERDILAIAPQLATYLEALKTRAPRRGTLALRRVLRMLREYPTQPVLEAVRTAEAYGLYDLERLERMVLRNIAKDFFPAPGPHGGSRD